MSLTAGGSLEFGPVSINTTHFHFHQWGTDPTPLAQQVTGSNDLRERASSKYYKWKVGTS